MKSIVESLLRALGLAPKTYKIQTFTYYIPAPPHRKTGYREKHFDKVFYDFINIGYKILNMHTQSNTGASSSGMWVIFTVQATNKEAESLNLDRYFQEEVLPELEVNDDETVEGLYQINS